MMKDLLRERETDRQNKRGRGGLKKEAHRQLNPNDTSGEQRRRRSKGHNIM
jgi:hypothetical protein